MWIKYLIGIATVFFFRLMPHPPNVEPIMATMMPFAKRWGKYAAMIFTSVSIILFDLLTGTIGEWTLMTVLSYAIIGLAAGYFFNKRSKIIHYVGFSFVATLFYDAVTGIGTGVLFFGQGFMETLLMQIPFTLYHLAGNVVLAAVVSPLLYRWVLDNHQMDDDRLLSMLSFRKPYK
ncbi:MAG: DUF6580 family putative transport protein [Nanobdellota archaeon]